MTDIVIELGPGSAAAARAEAAAVNTAADRVQTGLDATATAADRVQTGLDATATAADRVQTGLDATATAADRVQTGLDATATAASAGTAATHAGTATTQAGIATTQAGIATTQASTATTQAGIATTKAAEAAADAASVASAAGILDTIPRQQSRNRFDPNNGQAAMNSLIHNTNGNVTALSGYAVSGAIPCVAGTPIVIDLTRAPANWSIYDASSNGGVTFYTAESMEVGNRISRLNEAGGGVVYENSKRTAYVTPPATATFCAFTVRDIVGTAPTQADFEDFLTTLTVYDGVETDDLHPVEPTADPAQIAHRVLVERSGDYYYIRVPYRGNDDACYRVAAGYTPGSDNGVIDFDGIRSIPRSTAPDDTKTAFDASDVVLQSGGDGSPPIQINNMYLGGGHGLVGVTVTKTSHGKTSDDVGSVYTDGAAKGWVIAEITSADAFKVVAQNTGTATSWTINGAITGDLTHSSGGTNTATITPDSTVGTQLWPFVQSYQWRPVMDGVAMPLEGGVYAGDIFRLVEQYTIPNAASALDHLTANAGSAPVLYDKSIQAQVEIGASYTWDALSPVVEISYSARAIQAFTCNYLSGMQAQKMTQNGDDTLHLYVPRCTTGTLASGQDISSNATTITVASADFSDVSNPPDRFWQMTKRSSEQRHAMIQGYSKNAGQDRTDLNNAFQLSSSEKMYPRLYDNGIAATPAAGTLIEGAQFWGAMPVSDDARFSARVLFRDAGKYSLYLHADGAVAAGWVALPPDLIGRAVTATFSDGMTCGSSVVSARGVLVESASGGELEILIG